MSDSNPDRALSEGFGASSEHSVLRAIERITGEAPRILLRDADSEQGAPPIIDPSSIERRAIPQGRGSYQILGEIARGGMGVVMKGHDNDLGRDVALKVLHKELAKRPEVLQRFVEEAQIGGQLQHPGIVPVYELGLMADERPYFTMKLVKGRTLAVLLAERKPSTTDRRRLLDVFESICQTMAYAHSRGVIHRDLKPANVMVGAFGEVQVVDWGLAKVLRQGGTADEKRAKQTNISIIETVRSEPGSHGSDSLVGSVMGTPAYMSPEQARGEVEKLDERSDVFSLGAILCEILTGAPPYVGESDKTLVEAASAKLEDATKRLDGCEADSDLVALCRECLTPAQSARPRSAEAVAQRMREHIASVEERARVAQIDAAKARVKAREEGRARKLTVGLAASVLVTVLVAGGGWAWMSSERTRRERDTETQVSAALSEATLRRGEGQWAEALAAVERARGLADSGAASDELRTRVKLSADAIDADASTAREVLAREARNTAFLDRLDQIRSLERGALVLNASSGEKSSKVSSVETRVSANTFELREAAYLESFKSFGIEVDSGDDDSLVESLRASGIESELARAMDNWAAVRNQLDGEFKDRSKRLLRVAMGADSDPWRRDLRAALLAGDPVRLLELAASAGESDLPPVTAIVLAAVLADVQHGEESLAVLRRTLGRHPADFPLLMQLGCRLLDVQPRRVDEALRFLMAARALRPESLAALDRLSIGFYYAKDFDRAIWMAREYIRLDPNSASVRSDLGAYLIEKGELDAAIESLHKAIEIGPGNAVAYCNLGYALIDSGNIDGAITSCRKAIELDPKYGLAQNNLGYALFTKGDFDGAIASYRKAIELDPRDTRAQNNLGIALCTKGDLDGAIAVHRKAIEVDPKCATAYTSLGNALCDNRDFDGAIAAHRKAIELDPKYAPAQDSLGNTLDKKGDLDGAIAAHRKAIEFDPKLAGAYTNLGSALRTKGDVDEAIAAHRKAIELDPKLAGAYSNLGYALLDKGEIDGAIAAVRKAIELDSKLAQAYTNLGFALLQMDDVDGAIAAHRKAIELDPKLAGAYSDLGSALRTKGDLDEAIAACRKAIVLDPKMALAYTQLGQALLEKGDVDGAITAHSKAIELDPKSAIAHMGLGGALHVEHDLDGAIVAFRDAIELDPKNAVAQSVLGIALSDRGDLEGAIAAQRKAIDLDPKNAVAYTYMGTALRQNGDVDGAIVAYRKAIEFDPKCAAAFVALGDLLNNNKGDHDGAIVAYRKAIELNPKDAGSSSSLAWLLATCADPARRDGTEAVRLAQRAVELAPDASRFDTLGAALCCAGEWSKAIEALEHSLQLTRAQDELGQYLSALNHCFLANAHAHLGELDEARAEFALAKNSHGALPKYSNAADTMRLLDEARAAIEARAKR